MTTRTSVVHLITGLGVGGAETQLIDLVRSLPADRYRQAVVAMVSGGALEGRVRDLGVPVQPLGMQRGAVDPRAAWRLREILVEARADVLHTWMYHANLLGVLVAAFARPRPRVVWSLHAAAMDFGMYNPLTRRAASLGARFARWADAVVANSEATRAYHEELGFRPRGWSLIHNGIDVRRFVPDGDARRRVRTELGLPDEALLAGLFARFDPMKDHVTFLRAAALAAAREPRLHVVLAGAGIAPGNAELRTAIDAAGAALQGRVHLLGVRQDMPALNAALDVACVTSVAGESFCNAAAEAMACGVPCVVTDLTFLPTLVGATGRVVPLRDPTATAEAMLAVLALRPDERAALAAAARARIEERFSLERMAAQYDALYSRLLGAAGEGR